MSLSVNKEIIVKIIWICKNSRSSRLEKSWIVLKAGSSQTSKNSNFKSEGGILKSLQVVTDFDICLT